MSIDSAKAAAMRNRARKKLQQESAGMSTADKARLTQIRRRLGKKVRSSLPSHVLTPAT
ncbi:MAG: hypothetical protein H0U43_08775 [Chthoniobacterales bacterium]|nr:hypothetical protein [Chthoniobacterales bacterium]